MGNLEPPVRRGRPTNRTAPAICAQPLEPRRLLSAVQFATPQVIVSGSATAIATADFNGDGLSDLACVEGSKLAIYFGVRGGLPAPGPVLTLTLSAGSSIVAGDFNGDGRPDLAVLNGGDLDVFLNTGAGAFAALTPQLFSVNTDQPDALLAADVSGDGKADLLALDAGGVDVFTGGGDGTFRFSTQIVSDIGSATATAIAVGDFNGDGIPDVALAGFTASNSQNLFTQTFGTFAQWTAGTGGGQFSNSTTNIEVSSGVNAPQSNDAVALAPALRLAAVDLNHDGFCDLVIDTSFGDAEAWYGAGTQAGTRVMNIPATGGAASNNSQDITTVPGLGAMVVADFASTGFPQVAFAERDTSLPDAPESQVAVADNTGGTLALDSVFPANPTTQPTGVPIDVVAGDFDGDGKIDLATLDTQGGAMNLLTNDTGQVGLVPTLVHTTSDATEVTFGDSSFVNLQVLPASADLAPGQEPTGFIDVDDNGQPLVTVPLLSGANADSLPTSFPLALLPEGGHDLSFRYDGDAQFAASPPSTLGVAVAVIEDPSVFDVRGSVTSALPSVVSPGSTHALAVALRGKNEFPRGKTEVTLIETLTPSAPSPSDPNATPILLPTTQSDYVHLSSVALRFHPTILIPPATAPGAYTLSVEVNSGAPGDVLSFSQALTIAGAAAPSGSKYASVLLNGTATVVTFQIAGAGLGTLTQDTDGQLSIQLSGTNASTRVRLTAEQTLATFNIAELTSSGFVRSFTAPDAVLVGSTDFSAGVQQLSVSGMDSAQLTIGGAAPANLQLGAVTASTLSSSAPIRALTLASWAGATALQAPAITGLSCRGDFDAALTLDKPAGGRQLAVGRAQLASVGGTWTVLGGVGTITIDYTHGWTASISGALGRLDDRIAFNGQLRAAAIGALKVGSVSPGSTIGSPRLPRKISLGGQSIDPADDSVQFPTS